MASSEFRERLALASYVVVADCGMVSRTNLEALSEEGISYIIAERLRRKTAHESLARAGRYMSVTSTIQVKEVTCDSVERVIVCRNLEHAAEDAATRQSIPGNLEQRLVAVSWRGSLKPAARRYLKVDGADARLDNKRIEADARYDGNWILRTTTDLPADQFALAYRGLWGVENAFRTLKTPLELRPIHHTSKTGERGHVQTCVLAYLLTCILQDRLEGAHLDLGVNDALDQLARIQRVSIEAGSRRVVKTTRPNEQQRAILHAIGAAIPPQHQAT